MLVECTNCGAPLKTKPNRKTFQCGYCDCVNRVAEARTIAERDPRGWRQPAEWTPPANVPAASVPLHYHGGSGASRWVVAGAVLSAAVVVFALLGGRQQVNIAADGSCPTSFTGLALGVVHTCRCAGRRSGTVWGTQTYTADSAICPAAVHAGATSSAGGEIQVASASGCDTYVGSIQNGVQTNAWGSYGTSFYFPGYGQGTCAGLDSGTCPERFGAIAANAKADGYECECGEQSSNRPVWGSEIYTTDSSVCTAAVHAGAISRAGGRVRLKAAPACAAYVGTQRNGVTTGAWGAYHGSFYFPGYGGETCER